MSDDQHIAALREEIRRARAGRIRHLRKIRRLLIAGPPPSVLVGLWLLYLFVEARRIASGIVHSVRLPAELTPAAASAARGDEASPAETAM